jgi:hydroxyacylglutathione hydrolase
MLKILPVPAFEDNYIWLLHHNDNAIVVDPGDAQPVLEALEKYKLNLTGILITHHHHDHIDGVDTLISENNIPVYAPAYRQYPFRSIPLEDGQSIYLKEIDFKLNILWVPGHTLDHIAYYNEEYLFCGDTLFSAGCGRLFEGTPLQLLESLNKIKMLPLATQVFCTHEYTAKNISFALKLDPNNKDLKQREIEVSKLRSLGLPSLPSSIALELKINPFLRCNEPAVIKNSRAKTSQELDVFSTIRALRNNY